MAKFIGWVVIIIIIVAVIMNLGDDSEDSSPEISTTDTKPEYPPPKSEEPIAPITQSTQKDTPTPQPSAKKPKGKIVTVTGDYLIVCSDLPGLRAITNIDLADYPEEAIPQILDNTRCSFLYPGDQLRLNPDAPTDGDFVRLPIIEADADEYEMWTSTGFLMVYTDVIGVR